MQSELKDTSESCTGLLARRKASQRVGVFLVFELSPLV